LAIRIAIQLPLSESTDFDSLIGVEEGLADVLKGQGGVEVDGHDIGQGKFNIYVLSEAPPAPLLGRIRAYLEFRGLLDQATIAERPLA
jgi:hypothetical protein